MNRLRLVRPWAALLAAALLGALGAAPGPAGLLPDGTSPGQTVGFRGDGTGRFSQATPTLEWSAKKNVLWSTKIGPNKYSSPIVVQHRVFLVADPALLVCVDGATGAVLWKKSNGFSDLAAPVPEKPPRGDAGNTTPTPVSDGRFVYAVFGTGIVACYDLDGQRQWIQFYGQKAPPEYGRSASPALVGDKLLVTITHLMALDARTGKVLWQNKDVPEQYGTPIVAPIAGVEVAVMPSGQVVRVQDGVLLASDLGGLRYASPIVQKDTVYLIQAGSSAQQLLGSSTPWQVKQAWDQELEGIFYASPVLCEGLIYAVSNDGNFYILEASTGKILVNRVLDLPTGGGRAGAAGGANLYPSLAVAGNVLLVLNDQGDAIVLELGPEGKELRRNHLESGHGGTPAFDGKFMYLRGEQNLFCIGEAPSGR